MIIIRLKTALAALLLIQFPLALASPAEHLAQSLTYKTISYQNRDDIDYGEFGRLQAFLRETYPRVFDELAVEVVNEYSLLIDWPGSDAALKPVLFTAHTDVVPVEPGTEEDWAHPPYAGVIAEGNIYGRGTLDDKVGVIAILEAVEQLLAEGYKPSRRLVLAFGHDEEISGLEGASALAQRMRDRGMHFEWMLDEGGMLISDNPMAPDSPVALVNVAEKAYLTLTLTATGPGGHSSRPPRHSTIGRLSRVLADVEANPMEPRLVPPVRAMLETMAPHTGQPNRFFLENLWLTESLVARQMAADPVTMSFVQTTTALTMFNAGVKENVVPQLAEAKINFRLLPGDTPDTVVSHVQSYIDDPAIEITYEPWGTLMPTADFTGGGFEVISAAVTEVYPDALVVPSLLAGATDSRHYVDLADNHYRFHGAIMTAEQAGSIHGTNEYISVESFNKTVEFTSHLLRLAGE